MNGERIRKLFANKTVRLVALLLAALLLLLVIWQVFFAEKSSARGTEAEQKLVSILERIDGVDSVSVLIGEEDGMPVSAIVVLGGADSLMARSRVVDATAAALSIEKNKIQVYPAKG
ncbi:MAG: hypothetical protein K2L87_03410 [Clostridiales bacterium]|nr:hypothetical protein [Clostridiales bacterium]